MSSNSVRQILLYLSVQGILFACCKKDTPSHYIKQSISQELTYTHRLDEIKKLRLMRSESGFFPITTWRGTQQR